MTLVTVITPTWQRHHLLLQRAIPSVQSQSHTDIQHLVCSDGPDAMLRDLLTNQPVTFIEVPDHHPGPNNFGSVARNYALQQAGGDYIAYLDDDNAWRPDHVALLVQALDDTPDAGFAYSQMLTHPGELTIGTDPPVYGGIDTSIIMQRRALLPLAQWPEPNTIDGDQHAPDWAIVASWLAQGVAWIHVPVVTVDYHFPGS